MFVLGVVLAVGSVNAGESPCVKIQQSLNALPEFTEDSQWKYIFEHVRYTTPGVITSTNQNTCQVYVCSPLTQKDFSIFSSLEDVSFPEIKNKKEWIYLKEFFLNTANFTTRNAAQTLVLEALPVISNVQLNTFTLPSN